MNGSRTPSLGVAMVGHAFMGAAHSHAWRTAPRFFDLPRTPELRIVVGRDEQRTRAAADQLGWPDWGTDWRRLLDDDRVDLIDICTPGDTHAEIAEAALAAGKHVLCEKPLANTVSEAAAMTAAACEARRRGVRAMVGFSYRRVPAIALARQLVVDGRLGTIHHVRAQYLQDWLTDPSTPLSWRLRKDMAGSGALGDIGAHIIDLAQHLTGQRIEQVTGVLQRFVSERPLPLAGGSGALGGTASGERGLVDVDDATTFLARFDGGLVGTFEATRSAAGRKNALRIELNGSQGSLAFDFEDMNHLSFHDHTAPRSRAGFGRIQVTERSHPYAAAWWPPGHGLGYEHSFTHQVVDLVRAIAAGEDPSPSFADGLQVQAVLEAVERSAASDHWEPVELPPTVDGADQ